MFLDVENRRIRLTVRELAEFRIGPAAGATSFGGRWRAETGIRWHNELRQQAEATHAEAQFEVALSRDWHHRGWQFEISGRVDQLLTMQSEEIVREIKTVRRALPCDPEDLRQDHPHYFNQAAIYHCLLPASAADSALPRRTQLVFVDIDEGISQVIDATSEAQTRFAQQLDALVAFAESRLGAVQRHAHRDFAPAFTKYRPYQEQTRDALSEALNRQSIVLFEAPTGFGKTGVVLETALSGMKNGLYDRIVYLTGKSTGQATATLHLQRMVGTSGFGWYFQMRNRAEHDPLGRFKRLPPPADLERRWRELNLRPYELFENATVTLESILQLAGAHDLPAYPLSRATLPFADIWIGDYNYVFSPRTNSVFLDQPGFTPSRTLLIVDEAHNLPSRVADGYSFQLQAEQLRAAEAALRFTSFPGTIPAALDELAAFLEEEETSDEMEPDSLATLLKCLDAVCSRLLMMPPPPEEMDEALLESLWALVENRRALENERLRHHCWMTSPGVFRAECLDVSVELGQQIGEFAGVVLMSATLNPAESFLARCGIGSASAGFVQAPAPWRDEAYSVAIDRRVDTRWRERKNSFRTTAETVLSWVQAETEPVAVFFPSYAYAQSVREYMRVVASWVRVAMAERRLPLSEQEEFIESALLYSQALFLVMGSGYTEGIDHLGGRVSGAIVVGPALPEVSPAQNARMRDPGYSSRDEAFREVYLIPGMTRINQALGRLVRRPEHHARVLLHCQRFTDPKIQQLLAPEYRTDRIIRNEAGLQEWLLS